MDEINVNAALQELAAELDRAVDGYAPTREGTLAVARKYRALRARLSEGRAAALSGDLCDTGLLLADYTRALTATDRNIEEARSRVLQVFGTSAWDEPETSKAAPPAPAIGFATVIDEAHDHDEHCRCGLELQPPPLTDEELDSIEKRLVVGVPPTTRDLLAYASAARNDIPRLVAEVRRLRTLLTQIESAGGTYREQAACPVCHEVRDEERGEQPHAKGCALAAALGRKA